jgi:hypothetical protein
MKLVLIPVAVLGLNSSNCDCQWLLQTYLFIFSLPTCICFPPFTFFFPLPVLLISSFPFALYDLLPFTLFTQTDGLISPRGRRGNIFLNYLPRCDSAAEPGQDGLRDPGADGLLLPPPPPLRHHPALPPLTDPVSLPPLFSFLFSLRVNDL